MRFQDVKQISHCLSCELLTAVELMSELATGPEKETPWKESLVTFLDLPG